MGGSGSRDCNLASLPMVVVLISRPVYLLNGTYKKYYQHRYSVTCIASSLAASACVLFSEVCEVCCSCSVFLCVQLRIGGSSWATLGTECKPCVELYWYVCHSLDKRSYLSSYH